MGLSDPLLYVSEWSAFVMTGLQTGRYGAENFTLSICHGPLFLWSPFRYKKWPLNTRAWEPAFTFTPAPTLTSTEPKKKVCVQGGGGGVRFAAPALTFSASSRLWCLTDYTKAPAPSPESFFGSPPHQPLLTSPAFHAFGGALPMATSSSAAPGPSRSRPLHPPNPTVNTAGPACLEDARDFSQSSKERCTMDRASLRGNEGGESTAPHWDAKGSLAKWKPQSDKGLSRLMWRWVKSLVNANLGLVQ